MKRLLLLFFFTTGIICKEVIAQTPTLQQKLYYTCKIWGFVKYYHSNVSTCGVNWDSVLLHTLPLVRSASTNNQFNDALDSMLAAAGPMALTTTYFPDTLPASLKRNRNWGWIDASPILRTDVQVQLDTIKNNFRPHANCRVEVNPTPAYGGYLYFPGDEPELNINSFLTYPDNDQRQLIFFKYWNIANYFDPYDYVLDTPWDTTLSDYVIPMDTVSNSFSFYLLVLRVATALDDAHAFGLTIDGYYGILPGNFEPGIFLKYADSQYVVLRSQEAGIYPGDVIVSVDGIGASQWEDSLKQYYSSGNLAVMRRSVCLSMLGRQELLDSVTLVIEDSMGTYNTFKLGCTIYAGSAFFTDFHYAADSLDTTRWAMMTCGAGYINNRNISEAEVTPAYTAMQHAPAIIIDDRNYPRNNAFGILYGLLFANTVPFASLTIPDVTYPGTYYWLLDTAYEDGNPTPYTGLVIVLINEETLSAAEFEAMYYRAQPNVIIIASQTDGADGGITTWQLTSDIRAGFTSMGVYYPNGDSTQRIGIVPDSVVYSTIAGIRHGDDEVLDKALQIACAIASSVPQIIPEENMFTVFPNPAVTSLNILSTTQPINQILITNLIGQTIFTQSYSSKQLEVDISALPSGVYFVKVNGSEVRKFVKQ